MQTPRVPWFSIGLLSAAALAYEVLLTRLFALVHWHHLVGMIVSLALLGYGASGSFLALLGSRAQHRFKTLFLVSALLFAAGSVAGTVLAARFPLNPLELPWDPRQWGYLAAVFGVLAIPFFGVANCIGLALWRFKGQSHRLYGVDLLGAGAGSVLVLGLLFLLPPPELLPWVGAIGLLAMLLGAWELGLSPGRLAGMAVVVAACGAALALSWRPPEPAAYKGISLALAARGAAIDARTTSPLGVLTVLRNDEVPYRYAPGLSLLSPHVPLSRRALFLDNEFAGALAPSKRGDPTAYTADLISALPYALLQQPRVMIPHLGDAGALLQALDLGAEAVTVVEPNAALVRLLREDCSDSTGTLLTHPAVRLHVLAPRAFLASRAERFDLIQLVFTGGVDNLGLQAQQEGYLYTLEAFRLYLERLEPDGLLAVTRWLRVPPRDSLRLLATARDALVEKGTKRPEKHLALIRDWRTYELLVSASPLTPLKTEVIERFAKQRAFDVVYYAGLKPDRVNRHHRLSGPLPYQGVIELLGEGAEGLTENYPFRIRPSSDDSPFPYRFTRWREMPRLLLEPGGSGYGQLDWGLLTALATLVLALLFGLMLVLIPVARLSGHGGGFLIEARVLGYFTAVGIGFLFIELAFIQRFQLFLGHPVYATAVVLAGFLVFSGIGSLRSRDFCRNGITPVILCIGLIGIGYLWLLPPMFESLMGLPLAPKALVSLVMIAPLGFFMGMPFPIGLARLADTAPGLLPWAWGINGCASVVSAAAAPLLAMEIGFSGLLLCAVFLYLLLPLVAPRISARSARCPPESPMGNL